MQLSRDQLKTAMPLCDTDKWLGPFNDAMARFEIDTPDRSAAFLAQVAHESAETTRLTEGLSYSRADRLCAVWPKRFPTPESAQPYVRNPEKLANFVYASRGGNGDALNLPLVANPDLALTPDIAALTAAHYWQQRGLNALADHQPGDDDVKDFEQISIRINGGRVGLPDRKKYWAQAQTALGTV